MVVKCKQLTYTPVNALSFKISGGTKTIIPHKINNIIQSLESPEGIIQSLGVRADIKGIKYKANIIEEKWYKNILTYEVSCAKRNKSSIFVMPMLSGNRNLFFWNQLFLNCFIATEDNKECIVLLFRFSSDPLFIKFEKALTEFRTFIKKEDPHPGFVYFVFNIPKNYYKDYQKFINGKYSELSKLYKINLLEFHNFDVDSLVGKVIFQSLERKKELEKKLGCELDENSELLSIIDIENETFNPEIYF
tara:strand:+ start:1091 stop:1834 length:744 start_codon:yes stop_codon:yes gene_type:complete